MLFSDCRKSVILPKVALEKRCQEDESTGIPALWVVVCPTLMDEMKSTMRHSTIGIAVALFLVGAAGLWYYSQNNPSGFFSPDQQAVSTDSVDAPLDDHWVDDPVDETQYLIRGQDPVKPPHLLRSSSAQPLPPNPLRADEKPPVAKRQSDVRPVAGEALSAFEFPTPPASASKPQQGLDELAPPSEGSLLDGVGFPSATPPTKSVPKPQPLPTAEPQLTENSQPAPLPSADPFSATSPTPIPTEQPEPLPPSYEGLSSITVGEQTKPSVTPTPTPLQNADPFGETPQTVAVPPPMREDPLPSFDHANEAPATASNFSAGRNTADPGIGNMEGTGTPGPTSLEGSQTPHITIEKVLPAEVVVDQPMVIKTVLRNVGRSMAKDLVLRDRVPQGTRLLSTMPEGMMTANGELVWSLGNLNANEQLAIEMRVQPYREGEIGSVATVGYAAEASARIAVTRPMLQVQVKAPQEVQLGQTVELEITISNPGSATATGVVLTEYVPDGLYHKDGKILANKNIDTLKPKEVKRLTLPLVCTGPGVLVNRLEIKANGNLSVEEKTTIRALAPKLNLEIVGPKQRFLERKAGYRLVVANPGTASAKNVELVVYLPKEVQFVSTNQSGVYEKSTHTVHWALEELPPQESGEIELVVLPIKSGEHTIRFAGNGQNGLKAEEMQSLSVDGLAALSFEVACLSNLIEVGRDTVYEVRVSNRGTKSSGNVVVTANLSEGMNFASAEGPVRYNSNNGVIQFEPLAQLESKGEKVYRITAKCLADGDHRISVKVKSDELQAPITKEESTRVFK